MKSTQPRWIDPQPVVVPMELQNAVGGNPLISEALFRRGYTDADTAKAFLDYKAYRPSDPSVLPDLEKAVDRLEAAIRSQEVIGVWGDFDADGQTSTSLLVSGLRRLGAQVKFHIPVRARESHGITIPFLETFITEGINLLISCDTGITAHDAVKFASDKKIDTIITDHHTLPPELPPAFAIVNPQRLPENHPLSGLCGVGCAYKVLEELYRRAGRLSELEQDLDLVAIGTVADVAVLRGDNRFLVQRGLEILRKTERVGLKSILELAEINSLNLSEEHIGFIIGPRMNALGRLGDANPIVPFLIDNNEEYTKVMALQLEGLNNRRKLLCDQVFMAAQAQIQSDPSLLNDPVLVLNHPEWPAGVIGIVASRLVELYARPVILLSNPPGEIARGSARSIEGVNITTAISMNQHLLAGFGGHPMAAGLGMDPNKIPDLRRGLGKVIKQLVGEDLPGAEINIDSYINFQDLNLDLVEELDRLAPFGTGNPPLIFASKDLTIKSHSAIGKAREHLQVVVEDNSGTLQKVIWWQGASSFLPDTKFDLAYQVRATNFKGQRQIQIEWLNAKIHQAVEVVSRPTKKVNIVDMRNSLAFEEQLAGIIPKTDRLIWREGKNVEDFPAQTRLSLSVAETLVIWSVPPNLQVLKNVLVNVKPKTIILLGENTANDTPAVFLAQLTGLIKYAINHYQGTLNIQKLACQINQDDETIRLGMQWLIAQGHISMLNNTTDRDHIQVIRTSGITPNMQKSAEMENKIKMVLTETNAFRSYYKRADPEVLLASYIQS